jgi:hypothetical protein
MMLDTEEGFYGHESVSPSLCFCLCLTVESLGSPISRAMESARPGPAHSATFQDWSGTMKGIVMKGCSAHLSLLRASSQSY